MRALSIAAVAAALAGCYGDMISTNEVDPTFEGTPIDPALELTCADPVETADDGHHNQGTACLGCHNGATAIEFTLAGTLYADPDGTTPVTGLVVTALDNTGAEVTAVTAANGNFYTSDPVTFPVTLFASACPDVVPMPIISALGDCNSCHVAGDRITFSP